MGTGQHDRASDAVPNSAVMRCLAVLALTSWAACDGGMDAFNDAGVTERDASGDAADAASGFGNSDAKSVDSADGSSSDALPARINFEIAIDFADAVTFTDVLRGDTYSLDDLFLFEGRHKFRIWTYGPNRSSTGLPPEVDFLVSFRATEAKPWVRVIKRLNDVPVDGWMWLDTNIDAGTVASIRLSPNLASPTFQQTDGGSFGPLTPIEVNRADDRTLPTIDVEVEDSTRTVTLSAMPRSPRQKVAGIRYWTNYDRRSMTTYAGPFVAGSNISSLTAVSFDTAGNWSGRNSWEF